MRSIFLPSAIITAISSLFFSSRPFAVFSIIALIIIYAVYCKTLGLYTHIRYKVLKSIPSFTNLYSTTTITIIHFISWIIAPAKHIFPACINSAFSKSMRSSTFTARFSVATNKTSSPRIRSLPTLAFAYPGSISAFIFTSLYNSEFSKLFPGKFVKFWHNEILSRYYNNDKKYIVKFGYL